MLMPCDDDENEGGGVGSARQNGLGPAAPVVYTHGVVLLSLCIALPRMYAQFPYLRCLVPPRA